MNAPIALPTQRVTFQYVLILEWLDARDDKTGTELHEFLLTLGFPTALVVCQSADDVRRAISEAARTVETNGIPLVHIESHGDHPANPADATFGANGVEGMSWRELGRLLAPINVASDFRLLIVGATCFGLGAIGGMEVHSHPAPFAACIGWTTSVGADSLRDALRALYQSMATGAGLKRSVESAARELRDATENFQVTSAPALAYRVMHGVHSDVHTPVSMHARVKRLVERMHRDGRPPPQAMVDDLPRLLRERSKVHMQEAWNIWFPPSVQEREAAYRLDWAVVERLFTDSATIVAG